MTKKKLINTGYGLDHECVPFTSQKTNMCTVSLKHSLIKRTMWGNKKRTVNRLKVQSHMEGWKGAFYS